jgi:pyridinium-3,5-bisthiocarboxylic acid mononucleotide nickel chelatase
LRALFFDCFSGAAGDMILGALLDAGASEARVRKNLEALKVPGWSLHLSQVQRGPLRSTRAEVTAQENETERSYKDIVALLEQAECEASVKEQAARVFAAIAQAEGRIHDKPVEKIVFHEVGGLDAIVDIVGSCAALQDFLPCHVVVSPIATGIGLVQSAHGPLPLPAPAVTELLQERGAVLVGRGDQELVTPTGAALLSVLADAFGPMPAMRIETTGYGAGAADRETPNALRVCIGQLMDDGSASSPNDALLLETNLDDMLPELVPYVIDSLLVAGAYDAWTSPIVMKKGRPGFLLSVLCDPVKKYHMMEIIFRETTTLGVRATSVQRTIADRSWVEVEVEGTIIRVKIGSRHGDDVTRAPEFEDVLAAAQASGLPAKEIYERALRQAAEGPFV